MTILLRMDDKMNRQLTCIVSQDDSANSLSNELVHLGFIHDVSGFFFCLLKIFLQIIIKFSGGQRENSSINRGYFKDQFC